MPDTYYYQNFEHGKTLPENACKDAHSDRSSVTVDGTGGLTQGNPELTYARWGYCLDL
jgi:hypothetical protein